MNRDVAGWVAETAHDPRRISTPSAAGEFHRRFPDRHTPRGVVQVQGRRRGVGGEEGRGGVRDLYRGQHKTGWKKAYQDRRSDHIGAGEVLAGKPWQWFTLTHAKRELGRFRLPIAECNDLVRVVAANAGKMGVDLNADSVAHAVAAVANAKPVLRSYAKQTFDAHGPRGARVERLYLVINSLVAEAKDRLPAQAAATRRIECRKGGLTHW